MATNPVAAAVLTDLTAGSSTYATVQKAVVTVLSSQTDLAQINEYAAEIAQVTAGRMMQHVNDNQKAAVASIVAQGIEQGWTEQAVAERIELVVGLHPKYASAVERYRASLAGQGVSKRRARELARQYADRLRAQRAIVIARTEMERALKDAQRIVWQQKQAEGGIGSVVRVVKTRPDCCDICRRERGKRRSVKHVQGGPPYHPQCHCWEELHYQAAPMPVHPFRQMIHKEDVMPSDDVTKGGPKASGLPDLERKKGGPDNWVEQTGGLPDYIDRIARHLHYERGMTIGRAIAVAVSRCRLWAAGGGNVSAATQAKAAKAIATWEAKKARAKAD